MRSTAPSISRRTALGLAAIGGMVAALSPHLARATEATVAAELQKLYGARPTSEGRIKLDIPQIAENGAVVPLNIDVASPMTVADHVVAVHVFADGNPFPQVVSYRFTPESGKASASIRIRLAQTENVIAIAEMSDGALFSAKANVKVTIGGCGG